MSSARSRITTPAIWIALTLFLAGVIGVPASLAYVLGPNMGPEHKLALAQLEVSILGR